MKRYLAAFLLCLGAVASAQTVTVKDTVMTTYGFSDPDLVPRTGKIYPYYRYQTFALEGEPVSWTMVVLENDFLRVKIFPEIGGKIWSVYDKTAGEELFYDNGVVKFRDIAMRGPWTSGGIEFNFGIIGHAPSCSAPVDFKTEKKEDGSVSCYVGVQELLTRTRWMVEINLPKDAAWLRTRTFWHNYSGTFQPYYHWANSGVTVTDDLRLVYPASYSISHGGGTSPYPVDSEGHDMSRYSEQAFGMDKSLHPGGSHKGYFGTYREDGDAGMLHYALRDEKLGRKYFSWAQSRQGAIWTGLLTDSNPQYVELQSGRLFNQNDGQSNFTPFKQFLFTPFGTDEWNEYWLPFSGIGGVDDMTLHAVVNASEEDGSFKVGIYPLHPLSGTLVLRDASGNELAAKEVSLETAKAWKGEFSASGAASLWIGGCRLWSCDSQKTDRPDVINPEFDRHSAQGEMILARCLAGMRVYDAALQHADSALAKEPALLEALGLKAMICCQKMDYETAYSVSNAALAIDTYDPCSNYAGGIAAWKLGKTYDALDRLEIAALASELRSAACTKLAEIHFFLGDREMASQYANKSLVGNAYNITALMVLQQCSPSEEILSRIESLDVLNHFPDAERCIAGLVSKEDFHASIKEEMKWQNYLEYAAWYHGLGLDGKAAAILDACPEKNALLGLWSAFVKNDVSLIGEAEASGLDLVFPFREESVAPLEWAVGNGGGWQSRYLLAMLRDFLGSKEAALDLVEKDDSDYAPYYAYRYTLNGNIEDIAKARSLDPSKWRYIRDFAEKCLECGRVGDAIDALAPYHAANKDNPQISLAYVKALIADGKLLKADKVMSGLHVLPFEGQSDTRALYRNIKLGLARQYLDRKQYGKAEKYVDEARLWPENLGVGKPYDYLVDTSAEDALEAEIRQSSKGL